MSRSMLAAALTVFLAACAVPPIPPIPVIPQVPPSPSVAAVARLDHLAINVSDLKASVAFYQAAFGFAELPNPFAGGGGVVWLDLGNGIALHVFGGRSVPVTDARERHIAITVADLSRVTDFLRSRGIAWQNFDGVAGEVQTRPDGVRQMFFRDPDGYWVEVNDALKLSARR